MTDREETDALAAEYVLGTLDADERAAVAARMGRDPALAKAVADWERRLSPLVAAVPPLTPPAGLLVRIEAAIDEREPGRAGLAVQASGIVELQRRLRRWRGAAVAASALAASLALFVGYREWRALSEPANFVGVFQKDDVSPAFLLAVDLKSRQLTIRRISAEAQPGKTYQLWIASARTAGRPESLGLIGDSEYKVDLARRDFDPDILQTATFGVSLEPAGGSPTGRPSPGALHTRLMPALP